MLLELSVLKRETGAIYLLDSEIGNLTEQNYKEYDTFYIDGSLKLFPKSGNYTLEVNENLKGDYVLIWDETEKYSLLIKEKDLEENVQFYYNRLGQICPNVFCDYIELPIKIEGSINRVDVNVTD